MNVNMTVILGVDVDGATSERAEISAMEYFGDCASVGEDTTRSPSRATST
jgi:hypothetical protein